MPTTNTFNLLGLPTEIIQKIIINVDDPTALVTSNKILHKTANDPVIISKWLIRKFGTKHAFESIGHFKKLMGIYLSCSEEHKDIGLKAFKCLINEVPAVPRYVFQRTLNVLSINNAVPHMIELLKYAFDVYRFDVSIHHIDTHKFETLMSENVKPSHALTLLKSLVEEYRFDVNFSPLSLIVTDRHSTKRFQQSQGFPLFLSVLTRTPASYSTEEDWNDFMELVRYLLRKQMWTFYPNDSVEIEYVRFADNLPEWLQEELPADLVDGKLFKGSPSMDAVYVPFYNQCWQLVELLLKHDQDRWKTEQGRRVLGDLLLHGIQKRYNDGVALVKKYLETDITTDVEELYKELWEALKNGRVDVVEDCMARGATLPYLSIDEMIKLPESSLRFFVNKLNRVVWDQHTMYRIIESICKYGDSYKLPNFIDPITNRLLPFIDAPMLRTCVLANNFKMFDFLTSMLLLWFPTSTVEGFEEIVEPEILARLEAPVEADRIDPGFLRAMNHYKSLQLGGGGYASSEEEWETDEGEGEESEEVEAEGEGGQEESGDEAEE